MVVERGVAPASVPRTHRPGRPRVTVRPHYGGPPKAGLDGTGRAGRKLRARVGEEPAVRVPEVRSRGHKTPRWSAERRAPRAQRARRRKALAYEVAPVGAPPPHLSRGAT